MFDHKPTRLRLSYGVASKTTRQQRGSAATRVAQTSKSAVSRVSEPAALTTRCRFRNRRYSKLGNLRYRNGLPGNLRRTQRIPPMAVQMKEQWSVRRSHAAFTLAELLVSTSVLVLLVFLATQLIKGAVTVAILGQKRMDADSEARQVFDRMTIDFAQMVKRTDVSYYMKTGNTPTGNPETGNDQIAFFSGVPGYYSQAGYNSNASLVAYRVNADFNSASYNHLERMGKGLALNGAYAASIPLLFLDGTPNTTIQRVWPAATSSSGTDSDCNNTGCYERAGPEVFRFEYYYLLSGTANQLSAGPWTSTDTFKVKDVAAIVVAIAVIEPKSRVLLRDPDQPLWQQFD